MLRNMSRQEVAMLAVGGAALGAALSQRAKGNGRAAAGSDLEAALPADFARVAAPAFTARAPEVTAPTHPSSIESID